MIGILTLMARIVYRPIGSAEAKEALQLWNTVFEVEKEYFQSILDGETGYRVGQTVGAFVDGKLVSGVTYFVRPLGWLDGQQRLVGGIANVSTLEDARRQGHSGRLLELAIDGMAKRGCAWSFLFTGVPNHYARYGWQTVLMPYREGALAQPMPANTPYVVEEIASIRGLESGLAKVYDAFNEGRPISHRRTPKVWKTAIEYRMRGPKNVVLVARAKGQKRPLGYVLLRPDGRTATVAEVAALPDRPGVLDALMDAAREHLRGMGVETVSVCLPRTPEFEAPLARLISGPKTEHWDHAMARPIADDVTPAQLDALFAMPSAQHWLPDDF